METQACNEQTLRRKVSIIALVHGLFFASLLGIAWARSRPHGAIALVEGGSKEPLSLHRQQHLASTPNSTVLPDQVQVQDATTQTVACFPPPGSVLEERALSPLAEYTVAKGDTLFRIARTHRVSVSVLQMLNPAVVPTRLKVGQSLRIPAPPGTRAEQAPSQSPAARQ